MPADAVDLSLELLKEGREAAKELREALESVGITLPTVVGDYPVNGEPFVRLGGLSVEEAARVARRLRRLGDIEEKWKTEQARQLEEENQ